MKQPRSTTTDKHPKLIPWTNNKCNGTAKNTVNKNEYDDYNQVLETNEVIHRSFNSIRRYIGFLKTIRFIVLILQK